MQTSCTNIYSGSLNHEVHLFNALFMLMENLLLACINAVLEYGLKEFDMGIFQFQNLFNLS